MASEPGPAIDLDHLGIYTQGNRDLELELLTMFLPNAQGYVDAMAEQAEVVHDSEAWWMSAHSLKGVSLGVGAGQVAEVAEAAELLRDGAAHRRQEQTAALRSALERVRRFVAELG